MVHTLSNHPHQVITKKLQRVCLLCQVRKRQRLEKSSGTSTVPAIANGPTTVSSGITNSAPSSTVNVDRISPSDGGNVTVGKDFPSDSSDKGAKVVAERESMPSISDGLGTRPSSSSAVCFSSSDPVLVPSNDSRFPGAVGAIKREVGGQRPPTELNVANTSENKSSASETGSSFQGKNQRKSPAVAKNHVPEVPSSSTVSGPASVSESSVVSAEATIQLPSVSKVLDSEEAASELQKKLENLHVPPRQHVILLDHILVLDRWMDSRPWEGQNTKDEKYHPVAGTVFNQLMNFNTLHHYMTDLARKYKTYRLLSPCRNEIYTAEPNNVEYILKTNFDNYGKGLYNYLDLKDLLGDGISTVDGEKWREQRKISSHEFSTKMLRDFSTLIFRKNAAKLANIVSEAAMSNTKLEIQDLFMKSTLDSIFKVAFGTELDSMCGTNEEGNSLRFGSF
ncbi:hypothetical protein KIW84_056828 [Lathyrus oleraceus]|uniref:Cytochrome P450 n=1 Tax=Pisum sativum TaxID=3888 RepID=A0A9D5AN28_PEA|nr:hypothetical protein KIW84_056828 [Pisum sativum]